MKAVLAIVALLAGLSGQMFATSLAPLTASGTVSPLPSIPGALPGTFINATTQNWQSGPSTTSDNGKVYEAVYQDAVTNDLDFYFEVTDCGPGMSIAFCSQTGSGTVPITNVNIIDYSNVTTGVGYISTVGSIPSTNFLATDGVTTFVPFPNDPTSIVPTSVSRSSAPGKTLSYSFGPTDLTAGSVSSILVIQTNAPVGDYNSAGSVSELFGLSLEGTAGNTFEPAVTPEPGFYGLMAFGVVALLFSAKRYSQKRAAHTA
ncbi:MAG: hypothetical protein ABSB15_18585 [Bryobacteraceae bacterium]|jgi:hypothetical protein